jgi:hypothetical protein
MLLTRPFLIFRDNSVLFNSLTFIVFFAVALGLHYAPLRWYTRKVKVLVALSAS